ncbi:hypothetical protein D3C72_1619550 [compost metagenome]
MRTLPRQRVVDAAVDHQFIRTGLLDQRAQPFPYPLRPADHGAGHHLLKYRALMVRQAFDIPLLRLGQQAEAPDMQVQHPLAMGAGQVIRFGVAVGGEQVHAHHHIRLGQLCRRLEVGPVVGNGLQQVARGKVRGKGIGQAQFRCQVGAEQAGTEDPHRDVMLARHAAHAALAVVGQVVTQLSDVLAEVALWRSTTQGAHGRPGAAWRTPEAQVDAARVQGVERAELLGHHQRRVVGQHDATGANADMPGGVGDFVDDQ